MTRKKQPLSARFMAATGKLRMFFGPAQGGSTAGPILYRDDEAHRRREEELQQWTVVRNPDGSTYLTTKREDLPPAPPPSRGMNRGGPSL